MKKIFILMTLAGFLVCAAAFAEAPELKNMMPNSWKKLTRLSEAEERGARQSGRRQKIHGRIQERKLSEKLF